MAKKLESPTSFTEFAPLSPEPETKSFSFWNFFRKQPGKDTTNEESPQFLENKQIFNQESASNFSALVTSEADEEHIINAHCQLESHSDTSGNIQNRNMASVLQIVRNMVDGKKMQSYKDSDFKQYWMPDSNCKECYECGDKFTTFRRRHHCRVCGQIFCRRCCSQGIPGKIIGYSGDLRVCTYCYKMVSSCMQSMDSDSDIPDDLQSFRDNIKQNLNSQSEITSMSNCNMNRRKSSVIGFREEDIAKAKPAKSTLTDFCCDTEYNRSLTLDSCSLLLDQASLADLYKQLMHPVNGVVTQKIQSNHTTFVFIRGCDIIEWLFIHNIVSSRSQGVNIGQSFLDANFFECDLSREKRFIDSDILYKCKKIETSRRSSATENQEIMEPLWVKEIQNVGSDTKIGGPEDSEECCVSISKDQKTESRSRIPSSSSSFYLDLDLKESRVKVSRPAHQEHHQSDGITSVIQTSDESVACQDRTVNLDVKYLDEGMHDVFAENLLKVFSANISKTSQDSKNLQQLQDEQDSKTAFEELNLAFKSLEINLLRQLLETDGLSSSWCDVILPIVHRVVEMVHPDVKNDADSMDIRQYVQFKKIPGGCKAECEIVSGVVFSKTVAHRKMKQSIDQPTLLLLSSPISYQRTENKLSSLDPVLMQEFEYLKNTIGKLTVCKPDILLVEKSVSRLAQEMLLVFGITVALNVKSSVMERVARCTQAAIVSTVDAHLSKPQLGTCKEFKVKTYVISGGKTKTLMFLDGCPANLGCTILLRGGSSSELKKVKQKVQFMLYVSYNWKLERSFLMDEFALPPHSLSNEISDPFDNDSEKDISSNAMENLKTNNESNMLEIGMKIEGVECSTLETDVNGKTKLKTDESGRRLETKCIDDFSDPLHLYLRSENDVVFTDSNDLQVSALPVTNTFRKLLDDIFLCCSLNVKVSVPYLETEVGKKCPLRKFFPSEIYWSAHFLKDNEAKVLDSAQVNFDEETEFPDIQINNGSVAILPYHAFTSFKITDVSSKALDVHTLLADFRARGYTITYLCPHQRSTKGKEKKPQPTNTAANAKEEAKSTEGTANTGLCWERKVDALDPNNHQKLAVLFCSYSCTSNNAPNYCVNPWVVKMDFYGCNDIPFGGFLERYCFRSSYVCPSSTCDTPMTEHIRKFVHGSGCIHILLHELSSGVQLAENDILMWSWCHKCKQASPVSPMSHDTWSFSFAKYLELRFYADGYTRQRTKGLCTHSLHHGHYQYFAHKHIVAIFQYNSILVWEIAPPSLNITMKDEAVPLSSVIEEIKHAAVKGCEIYNTVVEKLSTFKQEYLGTSCEPIINSLLATQKVEQSAFRTMIEEIQLRLTSPTLETMHLNAVQIPDQNSSKGICNFMWKVEDQVTLIKIHISESVNSWNKRIQDFISARKKEEKQTPKLSLSNKVSEVENESAIPSASEESSEYLLKYQAEINMSCSPQCDFDNKSSSIRVNSLSSINKIYPAFEASPGFEQYLSLALSHSQHKFPKCTWLEHSVSCGAIPDYVRSLNVTTCIKRANSEPKNIAYGLINSELQKSLLEAEGDKQSVSSSGSSYTYDVTSGIYAGLMVPEPEDNESYVVCHKDQYHEESNKIPTKGHERSKSEGQQLPPEYFSRLSQEQEEVKRDKKERTVKTLFSQFLSNTEITPIQSPFPPTHHIFVKGEQEKIPIIVYDEEPSSIIAYALASTEYEQKLQELRVSITTVLNVTQKDSQVPSPMLKRRQNSKIQSEAPSGSESPVQPADDASSDFLDLTICSSQEVEKGVHKSTSRTVNFHLEIQFSDSNARFYCRVYYAEQFRKLRCLVFSEGEERFIRSLSHCIPWVARGGKSGSTFCKTRDDRFILKQMQKLELQSFLEFAPSYFHYVSKACVEQKPTLLAKIVGVYRIGYKNTATNTASKMDLLVMENLFYNCNITRKYDLKGSIRNRLVNTSGLQEDDIVLLDENLLKINCDNPLYIRPHSKTVLTLAIDNDTQFLSDQAVMDYSLLVGMDEEKLELVVGIIDYIRTFTWDKKVEMIVKSSGILGGHGKMPTVVSPELYRMRFREAMDGYFLWVPDRWTGKDVDCETFK